MTVLAGTAGAGGMAPPTSTRISARTKRVQEHSSPVNVALIKITPRTLPWTVVLPLGGLSSEMTHFGGYNDATLLSTTGDRIIVTLPDGTDAGEAIICDVTKSVFVVCNTRPRS